MKIIPSIDILKGKVVRLKKGNYNAVTIYSDSVLSTAKKLENNKINHIHIVDLEGSKEGKIFVKKEINEIKNYTNLSIQFGGGIRSLNQVNELQKIGINEFVIGSLAIKNKNEFEKIVSKISADKIIIAADVKDEKIAVNGWTEKTTVSIYDHIKNCTELGINKYLITDISRDGMLTGPSIDLYKSIQKKFPSIKIIASGGVSSIDDLIELKSNGFYAGIVGKAYYDGKIKLEELKNVM